MEFVATLLVFIGIFAAAAESLECGDGYSCPTHTTCCKLPSDEWGCCLFSNAVCCDDHVHCCPQNTSCDPQGHMCISETGNVHLAQRKKSAKKATEEDVLCPDRRSKCPPGSTCCMLVSGKYGCCPVEKAKCCADHLHCCPHGYKCDPSGQRCVQEKTSNAIASLRKFHATPLRSKPAISMNFASRDVRANEVPPNKCGTKLCPALTTCCKVYRYGLMEPMCCPLQNGVCCEDMCCPDGYRCSLNGRCEKRAVRDYFSHDGY